MRINLAMRVLFEGSEGRSAKLESNLQAIIAIERLERIGARLYDAADWQDLLATP